MHERSNRSLAVALALATVFGVWEILFAGFMADDLIQLSVLEGVLPGGEWIGPFDLYTLADGNPAHVLAMKDAGLIPWFFDPHFEMNFFRPLSSALLVADHALFGLHPAGYRLHGVLWTLALVAAAGAIFRRVLSPRAGALALFVFVLSAIHAIFCWTAARHVVVAGALGFAALAAHLRWREAGWRPGRALSLVLLALSLAASEVGVAVAAFLLAYEVLGSAGPARVRGRAIAPTLVILAAYLVLWRSLGCGASAGAGYIDPLRDPSIFLRELPVRLAVLLGGVVMGGGADLWVMSPGSRTALAAAGALAVAVFAWLVREAWRETGPRERRAIRWLGAATIGSAIPFTGTPIGSRCLIVPFVGGAALLAVVLERWWTAWRHENAPRRRALGAACAILALLHVVVAPLGRLAMPVLLRSVMTDHAAAALRDAELDPSTLPMQTAVVLVAPDLIVGLHGAFHRILYRLPMPGAWRVLSWSSAPHRFVRTRADTLEMEIDGGGIESASMAPGTAVALRGMEATVLATGRLGPTRVRIRFDKSLDDPSLTLLAWNNGRLGRVAPPRVGGTIAIPPGAQPG